jgi:hypothetical protein
LRTSSCHPAAADPTPGTDSHHRFTKVSVLKPIFSSSSKRVLLVEPTPWSFVHSVSLCLPSSGRCLAFVRPSFSPSSGRCLCLILFCLGWRTVGVRLEESCSVRHWSGLSGPLSGLERREVSVLGCDPWRGGPSIAQTPGP